MARSIPLGPFEIHRCIGKGGMGEVWEGTHQLQQTRVAIKILTHRGARREAYAAAFRNEIRAVAGLNHPGVVTVFDFGEIPAGAAKMSGGLFEAGAPYIVMEYAHRGCLHRYQDALGWRELRHVLFTILDALAHAHACGVIHRDLKPANILVGCGGSDESGIKLTDFGLAHATDHFELPRTNDSGWGTPHYMAPEQFRGAWRDYGPWTDLYALGVMAFHLATGEYPFEGKSSEEFARAHTLSAPRPFRERFAVPDRLERWIARLMQKRPEDRYQCAADAAYALQRLGDPPQQSRPSRTVSMVPIGIASDAEHSTTPARAPNTASLRAPPQEDDATLLEQPATTLLLPDSDMPPRDTHAFSLRSWDRSEPGTLPLDSFRKPPPLPVTWRRGDGGDAPTTRLLGAGLGLFGLRTLPVIDRDTERDALWDILREVRETARARAVLLRGPAGTGKTRLAQWFCRRASEVGSAMVLRATFSHIAGPGDGLGRMLAQHMRAGGLTFDETRARVQGYLERHGLRDEVEAQSLSELLMPFGLPTAETLSFQRPAPAIRYGLLYRYLRHLAEDRPVMLWFDNVEYGADALAFAQFVLEKQHQAAAPVLFVATARNEALVQRPVETRLVGELAGNRRMRIVDVEALEEGDTEELVRELLHLSPDLARQVQERCAGNPLFAMQLVGDWVAGGKLAFSEEGFQLRHGVSRKIPDDLHTIWRERLAQLLRRRRPEDRIALEIAAAVGSNVAIDEWRVACAQFGVAASTELVRDLLEGGLATSDDDDSFTFSHGLFRESLERDARDAGRWRDINAACTRMLESRYPHREFPFHERYAEHVREAETPHLAVEPLLVAARARIDRSELETASVLLDQRDRIVMELGLGSTAREWSEGWIVRSQIALWRGQYERAEALAAKASIEARRGGWTDVLARASLAEGLAHLYRGSLDHAERLFGRAQESMRRAKDKIGVGECLLGLGRVAEARANFPTADALFEQARIEMSEAGHPLGVAQCLNALGDVARGRTDFAAAQRFTIEAREIFESLHNVVGIADCTNDLAEIRRLEGELESAEELALSALRMYDSIGSDHSDHVRRNLALTMAARGDDEAALQLLDEVRARFRNSGQSGPVGEAEILTLPVLVRLEDVTAARRAFEEATTLLRRSSYRSRDMLLALVQATSLLRERGFDELADEIAAWSERRFG